MVSSTTSSVSTARSLVAPPGVLLLITIIIMAVSPSATARNDAADEYFYNSLYEGSPDSMQARNLDALGGGNLLRDLSMLRNRASYFARQQRRNLDSLSGDTFGQNKRFDSYPGWGNYGNQKRNMDEMDRSGFSGFIKKKNFDEIDRAGFDSFVKRNFDEMDRAGFGSFVKRDLTYQQNPHLSSASSSQSSGVASSGPSQNHN